MYGLVERKVRENIKNCLDEGKGKSCKIYGLVEGEGGILALDKVE